MIYPRRRYSRHRDRLGSAYDEVLQTVCLPTQPEGDVSEAVGEALAPYDMNLDSDYNLVGEWDWWHIRGDFLVRPEYQGDPLMIHNPVHVDEEARPRRPLRCDGAPKRMLDFPAMQATAAEYAGAQWPAAHAMAIRYPDTEPLSDLLARYADPADARRRHLAKPLVQESGSARAAISTSRSTFSSRIRSHASIKVEDDYMEQAVRDAYLRYALITLTVAGWISTASAKVRPTYPPIAAFATTTWTNSTMTQSSSTCCALLGDISHGQVGLFSQQCECAGEVLPHLDRCRISNYALTSHRTSSLRCYPTRCLQSLPLLDTAITPQRLGTPPDLWGGVPKMCRAGWATGASIRRRRAGWAF